MKIIAALLLSSAMAMAQNPYGNQFLPTNGPIVMTATSQTSAPVPMGQSWSAGVIQLTGTSLTTATFGVLASTDNGSHYFAVPICTVAATPVCATTQTATANAQFTVNLLGATYIEYVTSGTFTGTNINLLLTASPNASAKNSSSGGGTTYTGTTPVVVTGTVISCPTCSTAFSPYPSTLTPPLASSLTFVNQRSYTATDKTGRLVVVGPSANSVQATFLFSSTALPSPPYTVQMCGMMTGAANSAISMGVAVLDNSNNAVTSSLYSSPSIAAFSFNVRWYFTASGTTQSGFGNTLIDTYGSSFTCERITDTGTTRTFYHSANGKSYYFVSSEASNTSVTPTKFGLFVYGNDSSVSTNAFVFDIYDLEVANSILPQFAN